MGNLTAPLGTSESHVCLHPELYLLLVFTHFLIGAHRSLSNSPTLKILNVLVLVFVVLVPTQLIQVIAIHPSLHLFAHSSIHSQMFAESLYKPSICSFINSVTEVVEYKSGA